MRYGIKRILLRNDSKNCLKFKVIVRDIQRVIEVNLVKVIVIFSLSESYGYYRKFEWS
jgi:hypothetical protein